MRQPPYDEDRANMLITLSEAAASLERQADSSRRIGDLLALQVSATERQNELLERISSHLEGIEMRLPPGDEDGAWWIRLNHGR